MNIVQQWLSVTRRPRWIALMIGAAASLIGAGGALAASPAPVVNEKFTDLQPAIAQLREQAGQDRRVMVDTNMLLTNSEKPVFWPLYDEYRAEREKLEDRRVRLITDYLATRDSMSEDQARGLMHQYFDIEKETIAVKERYYSKMSKDLSARTVARFFHIDQKLDAAVELALAATIPLVH